MENIIEVNDAGSEISGKSYAKAYHSILCDEMPDFLLEYSSLPIVRRLDGVGLLCGTDWTPLFKNKFFYSRYDHSVGVALIIWKFTHDKKQTLSGLFHDIAMPAFGHVLDFRNGDTENQESTEEPTKQMINEDLFLSENLFRDGIYKYEIDNYHKYPVADNPRPGLNADRLEYMYPSGSALCGNWTLDEIKTNYSFTQLLKNEAGEDEIGFSDLDAAVLYTNRFLEISKILQQNEDKVSMKLLADSISKAIECRFLSDDDLYDLDEFSIVRCFDRIEKENVNLEDPSSIKEFCKMWRTFRGMKEIKRAQEAQKNAYNISLNVKQRYVDPLVKTASGPVRVSKLSKEVAGNIEDFLNYKDAAYGSVAWL